MAPPPYASASYVRSLGVIFDSALSFAKHIDYIIKSCNFYIRNIGRIRQFLSIKACEKLVVALVTSRLDYCNSSLNGLSQTHMLRLQRVPITAARLICRIKKFEHISTSLQSLHWLPSMHCISSFAWRWPPLPSRVDLSLPPHTLIAF